MGLDWGQPQSPLFVLKESIVNTHAAGLELFAELIVVWWCHSHWPEEKLTPVVRAVLKCHLHNYGCSVPGLLCIGLVLSETVAVSLSLSPSVSHTRTAGIRALICWHTHFHIMKACFLNVSKNQVPRGDDGIIYSSLATFPDVGLLKYNTVTSRSSS